FSPNSQLLAIARYDQAAKTSVDVCKLPTGEKLFALALATKTPAQSVAFSRDGRRVAACSGTVVKVWDTMTRRELFTLPARDWAAEQVALSPDGQRLFSLGRSTAGRAEGPQVDVKGWDMVTGQQVLSLNVRYSPGMAVNLDGKRSMAVSP